MVSLLYHAGVVELTSDNDGAQPNNCRRVECHKIVAPHTLIVTSRFNEEHSALFAITASQGLMTPYKRQPNDCIFSVAPHIECERPCERFVYLYMAIVIVGSYKYLSECIALFKIPLLWSACPAIIESRVP
jgi:hypothetical protein